MNEPGVSGKDESGKSWVNPDQRQTQNEMNDKKLNQKLYGRNDLSNQGYQETGSLTEKEIFEALKRSPELDASRIQVEYEDGAVVLEGFVSETRDARVAVKIIENIPGVKEVINNLQSFKDDQIISP